MARSRYPTPPGKPLLQASYCCGFIGTIELKTPSLRFHDRDNRYSLPSSEHRRPFPGPLTRLSLPADGRWLLYDQVDRNESDFMLIENSTESESSYPERYALFDWSWTGMRPWG